MAAEVNSSDSDSFVGPASVNDPYGGLLGGLDETKPVFQFMQEPQNIKLPKYIPTRAPLEHITRTNFGADPTAATPGPPLPEPYPLSFAIDRKDGSNNRRFSMPTNLSRSGVPEGRPILKDLKDISMTNSFAPSSAPATAGTFSLHSVSFFGPASRAGSDASIGSMNSFGSTAFSPNASMANLDIADQCAVEDDDLLRGSTDQPQYRVDDVSTWARRGVGFLGQGMRPSPPMPFYGFVDPKMTNNLGGMGLGGGGSMPGIMPLGMHMPGGMQGTMNPSMGSMMGQGAGVPMSIDVGGIGDGKTQPSTPPSTVSPGVYQKGFNLPWSPKEGVVAGRASPALSTKKERRQSLTSPYSTGNSPPRAHAGVVRGIGGNNKRDSLPNMPLGAVPVVGQGQGAGAGAGAGVAAPSPSGPSGLSGLSGPSGPAAPAGPGAHPSHSTHSAHAAPGHSAHSGATTDDEGLPSASLDRPPLFQGQLEIDAASAHAHAHAHAKEISASE